MNIAKKSIVVFALFNLVIIVLAGCSGGGGGSAVPAGTNPLYTVTYNGNGNTSGSVPVDSTNYQQGQLVTVLGNTGGLVRAGYSFTGWNMLENGSGTTYTQSQTFTMGATNVKLYALWTQNQTYTVTYDSNGGTGGSVPVDTTNYQQGQTVTVLGNTGNLVKSSHTFAGWNTQADGNGTDYAASGSAIFSMGTANVVLYAKWTALPAPTLVSIAVTPAGTTTIAIGATQQFTATGTYSDNSTIDITASVTWASSDTSHAIVSTTGLVTAASNAAGSATIKASSNGISGYAVVKVIVNLPKSGQTTKYAAGDDGDLQKGVSWPSPRFTDNTDGTVTDNLTGLMWLKDANCIKTQYPLFDADGTAGDGVVTWQHAIVFVAGINAGTYPNCGGGKTGWRLPNVNDLESLVHAEYTKEATCGGACGSIAAWLNTQGFTNVQTNNYYWSSTTLVASTASAWFVGMSAGGVGASSKIGYLSYVWPVRSATTTSTISLPKTGQTAVYAAGDDGDLQRGVSWPSPRFTDNADGTVTDNLTGLMWLKDANCANTISYAPDVWGNGCVNWQHALDFVAGINSGTYSTCQAGHTDWRLPNAKELRSLVDHSRWNPALPAGHPFANAQTDYYWSSTTNAGQTSNAWGVRMDTGIVASYDTTQNCSFVWPVRWGPSGPYIYVVDSLNHRIVRMDDLSGTNWIEIGTQGSGTGQFSTPRGIFVDKAGMLYVVDASNSRIVRMDDMSGTNWTTFGTNGGGTNQFMYPSGIIVDMAGKIYVTDTQNHRIVRMDDMAGTNWTSFGTVGSGTSQFVNPIGIYVDTTGKIYVADSNNSRIVRMDDMSGTNWTSFGTYGYGAGQFLYPSGIFLDTEGRLYVTDNGNRIVRMDDMSGTNWTSFGTGGSGTDQFMFPSGIFVNTPGKIFVADGNSRIVRMDDMLGTNWTEFGTGGSGTGRFIGPWGISVR